MRRTPTAEELETAIADLMDKSPKEKLTPKEIRQQLQDANKDWKVLSERRVAKFAKRQHSSKKQKNSIFRKFKGERAKKNGGTDNSSPLEAHPGGSKSEDSSVAGGEKQQRKVGFRQSMTKLFTPSGKGKKSKKSATETSKDYEVPEEDGPVFRAISEIEESTHFQVDPNDDYDILTPVQAARLYTVQPMQPTPKEGEEADEVVTPVTKESEEEMSPDDAMTPRVLEDAYLDDNDGKRVPVTAKGVLFFSFHCRGKPLYLTED